MSSDEPYSANTPDSHLARLSRSVDATLAAVLSADFPTDPILGKAVSDFVSRAASLQKRHGILLEAGIVAALRSSGRYEVLTSVSIPITAAADSLVASTPPEMLDRLALRYDAPVSRTVSLDFVAIDVESGWAGGYDCKRGNGTLTTRLLRPLVRDLECTGVLLRAFLRDRGYATVDRVTVGVVDVYGQSGVPDYLAVNLPDLDRHFDVPVVSVLDAMNARLEAGFSAAVPALLATVRATMGVEVDPILAAVAQEGGADRGATRRPARFSGPAPRSDRRIAGPLPSRRPGAPTERRQVPVPGRTQGAGSSGRAVEDTHRPGRLPPVPTRA